MKRTPLLLFALRKGQWVSIAEVPSGIACTCVCPSCGEALLAKKGSLNQHHFAHLPGSNCAGGVETALHRFAKMVITQARGLRTPAVEPFRAPRLRAACWEQYEEAWQEKSIEQMRFDVLLKRKDRTLAVEVKVTHRVDTAKVKKAARLSINLLEIDVAAIYQDLSAVSNKWFLSRFRQAILNGFTHRRWLFNLWQHRYEYRLRKQALKRKVHTSKQQNYFHYLVYRCPLRRRFVRSGFREGQSYARVFQDCLHCVHCREVEYQEEQSGFRTVRTIPQSVYCNEQSPTPKKHG